ncbi:MAG: NAD-dependent epimerase/dehydratase family protein [Chloroflexota bacterium]
MTGASGFVGGWLTQELVRTGHEVVADPGSARVDVTDWPAVSEWVGDARPDAVVHLAAIASGRDVEADPGRATAVAVIGTANVAAALARTRRAGAPPPTLLVAGSGEVYGVLAEADLPVSEQTIPRPRTMYGTTKLAQESVALSVGVRAGLRVVVARSFNHTGPGQHPTYAVAAFADRILAAREAGTQRIAVGRIDVRRDLTDVRDVVVAYRQLVEVAPQDAEPSGTVVNVASGRSVLLRDVVERLGELAGVRVAPVVDPQLVRSGESPEVRVDVRRIEALTGWRAAIELETTLRDVLETAARSRSRDLVETQDASTGSQSPRTAPSGRD